MQQKACHFRRSDKMAVGYRVKGNAAWYFIAWTETRAKGRSGRLPCITLRSCRVISVSPLRGEKQK